MGNLAGDKSMYLPLAIAEHIEFYLFHSETRCELERDSHFYIQIERTNERKNERRIATLWEIKARKKNKKIQNEEQNEKRIEWKETNMNTGGISPAILQLIRTPKNMRAWWQWQVKNAWRNLSPLQYRYRILTPNLLAAWLVYTLHCYNVAISDTHSIFANTHTQLTTHTKTTGEWGKNVLHLFEAQQKYSHISQYSCTRIFS